MNWSSRRRNSASATEAGLTDAALTALFDSLRAAFRAVRDDRGWARHRAALRKPPKSPEDQLETLPTQGLTETDALLRQHQDRI